MDYLAIDTTDASISRTDFVRHYLAKNKPLLIKGGASHWDAIGKWNFDFFRKNYGQLTVPLGGIGNDILERRTFNDYLDTFDEHDRRDLNDLFSHQDIRYLRAFLTLDEDPKKDLRKRILSDLSDDWGLLRFMPSTLYMTPAVAENWQPSKIDVSRDDMGIGMFFSPRGAITELHQDCCQSDGFLAQIEGTKRAYLMSPDQSNLVEQALRGRDSADHAMYPHPRFGDAHTALVADLEPGDVLYIPSLWIHEVYTLTRSISISIHCIHAIKANYILDLGAKVTEHLSVCYLSDIAFGEGLMRLAKALPIAEQIDDARFASELEDYGVTDARHLKTNLIAGGQAMAALLGAEA